MLKSIRRYKPRLDGQKLVERLPEIEYRPAHDDEQLFDHTELARVLLLTIGVDQESEYRLCLNVIQRAVGSIITDLT
ncbi:hypothetical protein [Nocardia concava]|uniref:hypothetical protein n=1 Tax=Nocardia concava TaxID=257281 RepID=UPI0002FED2F0|nr:hypothetical protein [Nocardia concava]